MTTSIFIANNGPKPVYVLAWDGGREPALLATLEVGQTTQPEHCHVFEGRMIVVSESKPAVTAAVAALEDDEHNDNDPTEPHAAGIIHAGDKL